MVRTADVSADGSQAQACKTDCYLDMCLCCVAGAHLTSVAGKQPSGHCKGTATAERL